LAKARSNLVLIGIIFAFVITWLVSRAIGLVRFNSAICFWLAALITAAVIGVGIGYAPGKGVVLNAGGVRARGEPCDDPFSALPP
jgi:hypothetical protein